jgi:hypothetical protein
MRKYFLPLVCVAGLYGTEPPAANHISYDTDLFKKDTKAIFFNAEALCWTVDEGALDYAIKMDGPGWASTEAYSSGSIENATFNWEPGFRLNVGYFNAPHYWDAYLEYTYFVDHGSNSATRPTGAGEFLNGTWAQPDPNVTSFIGLAEAHSQIHFHYNMLDLIATRRFHPNEHFRIRLAGGATVAWLRQDWKVHYRDQENEKSRIRNHWRFTGAGLRLALMLDWFLGKWNVYFTGKTSVALLGGQYHNVAKQTTTLSPTNIPMRNAHLHDTRLALHWQFLAGPSWQKAFGSVRTELFLGYEFNAWSNLHEIIRSTQASPAAAKELWYNMSLIGIQGVTFRWNLDF